MTDNYPFVAIRVAAGIVARSYLTPGATEHDVLRKAKKIANEWGSRTAAVMSEDRSLMVEPGDVIPLQVRFTP
jgi:hypothetical protein